MPGGTTERRPLASGPSTQRETRLTVRRPSRPSPEPGPDPVAAPARVDSPGSDRSHRHLAAWLARHIKGRNLFAIDLIGIVVAAYLALALRFDQITGPLAVPELPFVVVLLLTARTISNIRLGLYDRRWRYASVPELEAIVGAVVLGSLLSVVVFYGTSPLWDGSWAQGFPRSFWFIEMLLSIAILGGVRFGIRVASEFRSARPTAGAPARRATLLYGAGRAGVLMARSAQRYSGADVQPVGFLDDDPNLAGGTVAGLRVFGGLEAMDRAVAETGAKVLLITMPGAPGSAVRRVLEAASALDLDVRTVPSVTELLDGSVNTNRVRRIRVTGAAPGHRGRRQRKGHGDDGVTGEIRTLAARRGTDPAARARGRIPRRWRPCYTPGLRPGADPHDRSPLLCFERRFRVDRLPSRPP